MSRIATRSTTLALLFIAHVIAQAVTMDAAAAPHVPAHDGVVLEVLPESSDPKLQALRALREQLRERPSDLDLALRLAWGYVERGRATADPRYVGWAHGAVKPFLSTRNPSRELRLLRATLRQHHHDFDGALEDLDVIVQRNPRDARAWFDRSTVQLVQGRVDDAGRSCIPLLRLVDELSSAACLARAGAVAGRAQQSHALLENALDNASPTASLEMKQFARVSLAEISLQLGRTVEAEREFRTALAADRDDPYLIAAFADLLLGAGRPLEVLDWIEPGVPGDGLLLRRVLAVHRAGEPSAKRETRRLAARFAAAHDRDSSLHLAEEARFTLEILGRPRAALQLALRNFELQREPRDLRILLEAACAARDAAAVAPALAFIASTELEDVTLAALVQRVEQLRNVQPNEAS